jgi:hypothetical protein
MGSTTCHPAETGILGPADPRSYCNALIASDALTLLSPNWTSWNYATNGANGTLEQAYTTSGPLWTTTLPPTRAAASFSGSFTTGADTINAAILTGNLPTNPIHLPPLSSDLSQANFEKYYEGGWHNTFRFLEDWGGDGGATAYFRGSFVCMWAAATPGLLTAAPAGSDRVIGSYYNPPHRDWAFDTRFTNINNMPPGTPFLSTEIYSNWSERQ